MATENPTLPLSPEPTAKDTEHRLANTTLKPVTENPNYAVDTPVTTLQTLGTLTNHTSIDPPATEDPLHFTLAVLPFCNGLLSLTTKFQTVHILLDAPLPKSMMSSLTDFAFIAKTANPLLKHQIVPNPTTYPKSATGPFPQNVQSITLFPVFINPDTTDTTPLPAEPLWLPYPPGFEHLVPQLDPASLSHPFYLSRMGLNAPPPLVAPAHDDSMGRAPTAHPEPPQLLLEGPEPEQVDAAQGLAQLSITDDVGQAHMMETDPARSLVDEDALFPPGFDPRHHIDTPPHPSPMSPTHPPIPLRRSARLSGKSKTPQPKQRKKTKRAMPIDFDNQTAALTQSEVLNVLTAAGVSLTPDLLAEMDNAYQAADGPHT